MKNLKSYNSMLAEKKLSRQDEVDSNFRDLSASGDLDDLDYFLNHGNNKLLVADVNSKDPHTGMTALHNAASAGHKKVVVFLLDNGAAIDQEDFFGNTPLYQAAHWDRTGDYLDMEWKAWEQGMVAKLLIQRGADPFKAFKDPQKIIEFFKGDIDWMEEPLTTKLKRMQRGKSAFGM